MLRPDLGRSTLGGALGSMKITPYNRQILQSIAGTYPSNAALFKRKQTSSPASLLCGSASETLAHIQCRCPALMEADPGTSHPSCHAQRLWGRLTNSSKGWQIHREVSVVALGNRARLNCRNAWERGVRAMTCLTRTWKARTTLTRPPAAKLLRKRPDFLALSWKTKTVAIL